MLNLGGVANVTWIGAGDDELIAFDTGPGNALIDDWAMRHLGRPVDEDGRLAAAGTVDERALKALLDDDYFARPAPKSLDRDAFDPAPLEELSPADGAATLVAFTVAAVGRGLGILPEPPGAWSGHRRGSAQSGADGGASPAARCPGFAGPFRGWDGDGLEAQAFAYLAVRSLAGLPLSLPTTTGVPQPLTGGRLDRALG